MGDRQSKDALFDGLASVAKALGSGRRAELVDVLAQGERSVDQLAGEIGQSVANTSHHLQVLSRAGIVATRREGTRIHYRLSSERVADLWAALRDVASQHVAGFDQLADAYLDEVGVETISREELAGRLGDSDLVVLDVRPAAEFAAGHIETATFVPVEALDARLSEFPEGVEVVAYCRGPYCAFAVDAVRALQASGRRARRLEDGFPEWRRAGLPVQIGPG